MVGKFFIIFNFEVSKQLNIGTSDILNLFSDVNFVRILIRDKFNYLKTSSKKFWIVLIPQNGGSFQQAPGKPFIFDKIYFDRLLKSTSYDMEHFSKFLMVPAWKLRKLSFWRMHFGSGLDRPMYHRPLGQTGKISFQIMWWNQD